MTRWSSALSRDSQRRSVRCVNNNSQEVNDICLFYICFVSIYLRVNCNINGLLSQLENVRWRIRIPKIPSSVTQQARPTTVTVLLFCKRNITHKIMWFDQIIRMICVQLERNAKTIIWELHIMFYSEINKKKRQNYFLSSTRMLTNFLKGSVQNVLAGCLTYKWGKYGWPRHTSMYNNIIMTTTIAVYSALLHYVTSSPPFPVSSAHQSTLPHTKTNKI